MARQPPMPISAPLPFLALAGGGRKERRAAAFIVLLKVKRHPSLGLPDAASGRRMVALLDEVITPSLGGVDRAAARGQALLTPLVQSANLFWERSLPSAPQGAGGMVTPPTLRGRWKRLRRSRLKGGGGYCGPAACPSKGGRKKLHCSRLKGGSGCGGSTNPRKGRVDNDCAVPEK